MRTVIKTIASAAIAAATIATLTVTATPAANAAGALHGCPSGAVCIYPRDAGFNGDRPSNAYYSYGLHRLYNQYGDHYIVNNQTGGAGAELCESLDGVYNCPYEVFPQDWSIIDLTPINTVKLTRP